jgi:hypothetical protein
MNDMNMKTLVLSAMLVPFISVGAGADILSDFESYSSAQPGWNEEAKAALASEGDTASRLSAALRVLHPALDGALAKVSENPEALKGLANSADPYLAAESSFFLGREMMKRMKYEEVLPLMKRVNEDWAEKSPRAVESLYYQGVAENELLMRGEALESLSEFVEAAPKDSRLAEMAYSLLETIQGRGPGSIGDVADHMGFSERRLENVDPGESTQVVQKKIVEMLDVLIERAEQKEEEQQQQQQQGAGSSQSEAKGGKPANGEGNNAGGNASAQKAPKVVRRVRGSTKNAWDDLRQKDRNADALSALKSKYPPRYQQLIEQYYRDLNESTKDDGEEEAGK